MKIEEAKLYVLAERGGGAGFFSLNIRTFLIKMTEFVALDCYICGKHF